MIPSHVFNNNNQKGGTANILYNLCSEKERELYEEQISHLKKEIEFLREMLRKHTIKLILILFRLN